ncbi:MAG TPA: molybdenum cofactor guanylyltransferase [Geobacteraceae bacterium]
MTGCADITGVLLVGGKSRRMGRDKAFLKIGGVPLYERMLRVLEDNFDAVILVGDSDDRFICHLPIYPDIHPGSALGGLFTGIQRATTDRIFVAPCDIPFPSAPLVRYLCAASEGNDVTVPLTANGLEPLFAVYRKSCLPPMKTLLKARDFRIRMFYPAVKVRYVGVDEISLHDPNGTAFVNLNTPAEYERAATNGRLIPHTSC